MKKIKVISFIAMLLVLGLSCRSNANIIVWTEGDYTIPYPGWSGGNELKTYNTVTVAISSYGGVSTFDMHDSSKLTISGLSYVNNLNLYDNATASIFEDSDIHYLFVDSASTALVKLYAVEFFHPGNYDFVQGYWLNNPQSMFTIDLLNSTNPLDLGSYNTYSHVQFIPEPATLALLAVGFFAIRKRHKR